MSIAPQIGYCNRCRQNVLLKREDIDVCLILILLLFTAGIGLIIYLIIYYSKPKNRCVHCNSIAIAPQNILEQPSPSDSEDLSITKNPYTISTKEQGSEPLNFCAYCGEPIKSKNTKYCAHCGTKINV